MALDASVIPCVAGGARALKAAVAELCCPTHRNQNELPSSPKGRKARAVFARLDATGNKKVGLEEFIDGLQEMGIEVSAEDAEELLAQFDGQISMSGFMRLLAAQPDARLS